MDDINKIEILCLYMSYQGRIANYHDICNGEDYLDETENKPEEIWNTLGGFSITINGFYTIFNSCAFYVMLKPVTFLLNTVYWLHNKNNSWFNYNTYDTEVSIKFGMEETLTIKRLGENEIIMSYYPAEKERLNKRGSHFFNNLSLNSQHWCNAVVKALTEYFEIYKRLVDSSTGFESINKDAMSDFYGIWTDIVQWYPLPE